MQTKNLRAEFLDEIEVLIQDRKRFASQYGMLRVGLGVIITICGFLTAAASQTDMKATGIFTPTSLLVFGLLSAICAITNQLLAPEERNVHHNNIRKALEHIKGEVKFGNMSLKTAQTLRTLAATNPELILGKLQETHTNSTAKSSQRRPRRREST
jgi:hypothetical protein